MDNTNIYSDMARRTGGDIYIGVVGPVRTGKSTFIKRFMETLVIPGISDAYARERARDELPQSGSGRTIMTAEPKFVPEEAVEVALEGGVSFRVRLIDCVGYMVDGAAGQFEDGMPRMVTTPWFDEPVPMTEAAETGTRKVIAEHSTIGIVITTDGSVTDIPRADYVEPEGRVISELKELGKPFIILLNSSNPEGAQAQAIARELRETHGVGCVPVNCLELDQPAITRILRTVLAEFPLAELGIFLPPWIEALPSSHPIKRDLYAAMLAGADGLRRVHDLEAALERLANCETVSGVRVMGIDMGSGVALCEVSAPRELFYKTLEEQSGLSVSDDGDLMRLMCELAQIKHEYDKLEGALRSVRQTGYGIVMPSLDELKLDEPEIMRQGGRYGVRLRASAPSVHLMRADIQTEVCPIVGSEKQSEELIHYLLSEFEDSPEKIWDSNIFGKSLHSLISEAINTKLGHMPEESREKLRETLERVINEGSGGLICIIL